MEMEYFVEPGTDEELHQYWIDERTDWYVDLGIARDNLRQYEHPKEKLSHYSKRTVDIEYRFGFQGQEWGELEGIANRTDFDLTTHSNHSGVDLSFYDQASGTRYRPYVIEPAAGVGRSMMAFLIEAYAEDEAPNAKGGVDTRVVLRLDRRLAPVKAAVLPLSRNPELSPKARDLAAQLRRSDAFVPAFLLRIRFFVRKSIQQAWLDLFNDCVGHTLVKAHPEPATRRKRVQSETQRPPIGSRCHSRCEGSPANRLSFRGA